MPDRPENRLIRSALDTVLGWTQTASNNRLARELQFSFADIPPSAQYQVDISRWSKQRDMIHYRDVHPWVILILEAKTPWFLNSTWSGVSMLFPMEQLYERYLGKVLKKCLAKHLTLREQASGRYLTKHTNENWFRLRPDYLISTKNENIAVLDAKWKLLDLRKNNRKDKYGLSQADFYQLYVYGKKYLAADGGVLLLIFPRYKYFDGPLPVFHYDDNLKLWVIPFDMQTDHLLLPLELRYLMEDHTV